MNDIQKHAEYCREQIDYINTHINALTKLTEKMKNKLYQEVKNANSESEFASATEQYVAVVDTEKAMDELREKLEMVCMAKFMED